MRIDFNKSMINFMGQPAVKIVNGKEVPQRLCDMVAEALFSAGIDPQKPIETPKKIQAYKMFLQIINNKGIIEAETEDVALLKDICASFFTAGAYGQIHELIEGGK